MIHRLLECVQEVITSVQGAADMLGEQITAAAEAAVTEAARAAAEGEGAGMRQHISLHAPLLVFPCAEVKGSALLVRLGHFELSNSFTLPDSDQAARRPTAGARSIK